MYLSIKKKVMSEVKQQVEVFPPRSNINGEIKEENLHSTPQVCPCCQGNGYNWSYDENINESVKLGCKACDGSGMVVPVIRINWIPLAMIASKLNE